jgi:hypothetical protein
VKDLRQRRRAFCDLVIDGIEGHSMDLNQNLVVTWCWPGGVVVNVKIFLHPTRHRLVLPGFHCLYRCSTRWHVRFGMVIQT